MAINITNILNAITAKNNAADSTYSSFELSQINTAINTLNETNGVITYNSVSELPNEDSSNIGQLAFIDEPYSLYDSPTTYNYTGSFYYYNGDSWGIATLASDSDYLNPSPPPLPPTTLTYVTNSFMYSGATTGTDASLTLSQFSPTLTVGDLSIIWASRDAAAGTWSAPTGWSVAVTGNDGVEYPQTSAFYKILTADDISTDTITIPGGGNTTDWSAAGYVLSPDNPISTIVAGGEVNTHGPSALSGTITSGSATSGVVLATAHSCGRPLTQAPTLTFNGGTYDQFLENASGAGPSAGHINIGLIDLGTSGYSDVSVSTNDVGRQSLNGFYLEVT